MFFHLFPPFVEVKAWRRHCGLRMLQQRCCQGVVGTWHIFLRSQSHVLSALLRGLKWPHTLLTCGFSQAEILLFSYFTLLQTVRWFYHLDLSFGLCASTISAWWAHLAAMEAEWLLDKHVEAHHVKGQSEMRRLPIPSMVRIEFMSSSKRLEISCKCFRIPCSAGKWFFVRILWKWRILVTQAIQESLTNLNLCLGFFRTRNKQRTKWEPIFWYRDCVLSCSPA